MLQFAQQRAAIRQISQVVVVGVVRGALFGVDPRLQLDQHRRHRLQGVDLGGHPRAKCEVDEAEHAPRRLAQE